MIKKILKIQNIGRFRNYGNGSNDNLSFKKNTFIFGSNTHGKSTFTAILRSLFHQNSDYIIGRRTFSQLGAQEVTIQTEGEGIIEYKDNRWFAKAKFAIFDNHFISENVFVGDRIPDDKQKKISQIILGLDGLRLIQKYDTAQTACAENTKEKARITREYGELIRNSPMPKFEIFRAIKEDTSIDEKIKAQEKKIGIFLNRERIKDNLEKTLKEIGSLNDQNFDTALGRTISLEQENIKKHMTENLAKKDGATAFFKAGIGFLKVKTEISRKCPFCSECLGNDAELLIEDYNKFFSEAYSSLSKKRKESELYFEKWNIIIFLEQKESELEKLGIVLSTEAERIEIENNRILFLEELKKKSDLNYSIDFTSLHRIETQFVSVSNKIEELKNKYDLNYLENYEENQKNKLQLKEFEDEKTKLKNTQKRFQSPYKEICEKYIELEKEFNETLKIAKETAFKEQKEYAQEIFDKYEGKINILLKKLGAEFKLIHLKPSEKQRGEHKLFSLQFGEDRLGVVELNGPENQYNLRNSLSDSDKRILAFTFFIAGLQNRQDLSDLVVVLDDPMSSLDMKRKDKTLKILRDEITDENLNSIKQLIVLTHEESFFTMANEVFTEDIKFLRINYKESESNSVFKQCDIKEEFLTAEYFKNIKRLREMRTADDDKMIRANYKNTRTCLEHIIQRKYIILLEEEINNPRKGLSAYIDKLIEEEIYDPQMRQKIRDLYPNKSHHDNIDSFSIEELDPSEIRGLLDDFFDVLKTV